MKLKTIIQKEKFIIYSKTNAIEHGTMSERAQKLQISVQFKLTTFKNWLKS